MLVLFRLIGTLMAVTTEQLKMLNWYGPAKRARPTGREVAGTIG